MKRRWKGSAWHLNSRYISLLQKLVKIVPSANWDCNQVWCLVACHGNYAMPSVCWRVIKYEGSWVRSTLKSPTAWWVLPSGFIYVAYKHMEHLFWLNLRAWHKWARYYHIVDSWMLFVYPYCIHERPLFMYVPYCHTLMISLKFYDVAHLWCYLMWLTLNQ